MKKGDYLVCKRTYYHNDFVLNRKLSKMEIIKRKLFEKPMFIKDKRYLIHRLDDYINDFGTPMRCFLLGCELYDNLHKQVFIYNDTVQEIFYTEKDIRKQKLKRINGSM